MKEPIVFTASDGHKLVADLYTGTGSARAAVVIAPAMGVRRSFYGAFAAYLAERGATVLVFDYRGIGGSRPPALAGYGARLSDWGERDIPAAIAALAARAPGLPIAYVGHSIGGQVLGLAPAPPLSRVVFIASQSGYFGHWSGLGRAAMAGLWYVAVPLSVAIAGRLPMALVGQGEDVPAGVASEWAAWGRSPEYIMSVARGRAGLGFETIDAPLFAYAITDDTYAPRRGVEALAGYYRRAQSEIRELRPADHGVREIGHFGAFRTAVGQTLWPELAEVLLGEG